MAKFIVNWCKIMFTQTKGAILVRTALCQEGVIQAHGTLQTEGKEIVSTDSLFEKDPSIQLKEDTIYLNRKECSFVNRQLQQLLKAKLEESQRKKKAGIPDPPQPGKIAYAVYNK